MPSGGLCQGHPMSPYLFILGAGFLSRRLLVKTEREGFLHGAYNIAKGDPNIFHLLFADDSLIFCRASLSS